MAAKANWAGDNAFLFLNKKNTARPISSPQTIWGKQRAALFVWKGKWTFSQAGQVRFRATKSANSPEASFFLPAAKPTGHRNVRAVVFVVVVGLLWGHDPKGRPKVKVNQLLGYFPPFISHPKFSPGWDPSLSDQIFLRGGINRFSMIPNQIWLNKWASCHPSSDPNFSLGCYPLLPN